MTGTPSDLIELERKFFVKDDTWKQFYFKRTEIIQGYFLNDECPIGIDFLESDKFFTEEDLTGNIVTKDHVKLATLGNDECILIRPYTYEKEHINYKSQFLGFDLSKITIRIRTENGVPVFCAKAPHPTERGLLEIEATLNKKGIDALNLADAILEKTRYHVGLGEGLVAEVDVYSGNNSKLTNVVEVEFSGKNAQKDYDHFKKPVWFGEELTGDKNYSNKMLAKHPFNER